jgi:hypothetical protein
VTKTTKRVRRLILSAALALASVVVLQPLAKATEVRVTGTAEKAAQHATMNFNAAAREEALGPMPLNEHRTIHRPVARATGGALQSSDALATQRSTAEQQLSPTDASVQSPAALANFEALGDNGTVIPPDTDGAVGPHHLVVAVNSVVIEDRAGTTLKAVTIAGFWSSLGVTDAFDPHVLYDPYGQRWIFSAASGKAPPTRQY